MSPEPDGAMSPAEQFKEIRETLLRIDQKLDRKADIELLEPMIRRIELLESGETPLARQLLRQFEQTQEMVSELSRHGSNNAQMAVNKNAELELRFNKFEQEHAADRAVIADRAKREARNTRWWVAAATTISTLAVATSVFHVHITF